MSGADLSEEDIQILAHRLDRSGTAEPRLAGLVGYARMIGFDDEPDQEEAAIALRLLLIGVAAQPAGDPNAGQWRMAVGLGYGYRADVTNSPADWGAAISWTQLSVRSPHPTKADHDDAVTVLAELHEARTLSLKVTDPILLDAYVEATAAAVEANSDVDESHGFYSLMHVRALTIRWIDEQEPPEVQEQILENLAIAVRTTDDPEVWSWYASQLYPRALDEENTEDIRTALYWFGRYVSTVDDTAEDFAMCQSLLAAGYHGLWSANGDLADADLAIEHATQALRLPVPGNEELQALHRIRLEAIFPGDGRPDLAELIAAKPVRDWLADAHRVIETTGEDNTEELFKLSLAVGQGEFQTRTAGQVDLVALAAASAEILAPVVNALMVARRYPDLSQDAVADIDAFLQLLPNLSRVVQGDGDVDLAPVRERFSAESSMMSDWAGDLVAMLTGIAGARTGSLDALDNSIETLGSGTREPADAAAAQGMAALFDTIRKFQTGAAPADIYQAVRKARDLLAEAPANSGHEAAFGWADAIARLLATVLDADNMPAPATDLPTDPLLQPLHLAAQAVPSIIANDTAALRELSRKLGEMGASPAAQVRAAYDITGNIKSTVDTWLSDRVPTDRQALREAIDSLTSQWRTGVLDRAPGLDSTAMSLAGLLRRRDETGDLAQSRLVGLDALRSIGWQVLLQSGTAHALEIARSVNKSTERLIAWCVEDGASEDLVRVLDARRGLVLRAANTARTVAEQLAVLGHHDLAGQWDAARHEDAGELRRKVMRVLDEADDTLTTPPTVAEIQNALRRHGSDALVYLIAGNDSHGGMAVLVRSAGAVVVQPLPGLRQEAVAEYRAAYENWQAQRSTYEDWSAALTKVCEWAWQAAGRDLLRLTDADPRLVLVPVGELGLVPWHAARNEGRYLIEYGAFATVPSARMFCDLVARPDVVTGKAVFVGNPERDLRAGAHEAAAVQTAFYGDGVLMGMKTVPPQRAAAFPGGAGTPEQVAAQLRGPVTVLHLACHAEADMRNPLNSAIKLSGDLLSAKELLDLSPARAADLGLVTLAACATNMTGTDYDEALSLSTTFLAIGARSVIGSLWQVPASRSTAHLMFMVHHHLRRDGLPPMDALRRAQLWMLDRDRRYPAEMPGHLRDLRAGAEDETDIWCWAGFVPIGR